MASITLRKHFFARRTSSPHGEIVATDGELLMRFLRYDDQQAFAEVVERHGRLVWLICHQILRHHQDVEDAFQATFLILAQRASSIRTSDSASSWLFKVAQRTALAARRKRSRRREESLAAEPPVGEEALPMLHDRQMRYVLFDELRGLPAVYQTPLVLRYLEGQSRRAIADQTDSTVSQVQGRLARGRRILRSRLVRRGVSLSLAAGGVAAASSNASAAVTPALVAATATSCFAFVSSGASGSASPAALQLAREGIKVMGYASITKPAAGVASLLLAAGVLWAAQSGGGAAENPAASRAAEGVELQAVAADSAEGAQPNVAIAATQKEKGEAASDQESELEQLTATIEKLRDRLKRQLDSKVEETVSLEMEQLAKTLAQREVEQVHERLVQFRLPQSTPLEAQPSQEEQQMLSELREKLEKRFEELTDELESLTHRAVRRAAELEQISREVARSQRLIDELSRRQLQMEYARDLAAAISTTSLPKTFPTEKQGGEAPARAPTQPHSATPGEVQIGSSATMPRIVTRYRDVEEFRQAVTRQLDQVQRERDALQKENAELKKQLELRTEP